MASLPSRTTLPSTPTPTRCKRNTTRTTTTRGKHNVILQLRQRLPLLLFALALAATCNQSGTLVQAEPYAGGYGSSAIASGGLGSVGIHIPGGGVGVITEARCPRVCTCSGLTVDCSHRGLTQVPRKISADVERL